MIIDLDKYIKAGVAAEVLGVSRQRVNQMKAEGKLHPVWFAGEYLYEVAEVEKVLVSRALKGEGGKSNV